MRRALKQKQAYWLWLATLAASAVIAALAFRGWSSESSLPDRVAEIEASLEQAGSPPKGDGRPRYAVAAEQAVQRIRQRHLFAPRAPEEFRNVQGVLGDRVLYPDGRSFGIGQNALGATVVAIGSNWVELEHDGQTIIIDIFSAGGKRQRGPELFRRDPPAVAGEVIENASEQQDPERIPESELN